MTSMPTINDRMVDEFRRTGKQRASYSMARSGHSVVSRSRVVPQQEADCGTALPGTICWTGPCDPATRTRTVLRCNNSNGCTVQDTVPC